MGTEQNQDQSNTQTPPKPEGEYGDQRRQDDKENAASQKPGDESGAPEKKNRLPG